MKLTLEKKILISFITCSLILLFVAIISIRNSESFVSSNQRVTHTHEVLNALEQTLVNELDAETRKRGFVITGDEAYLDPFNRAMASVSGSLDKVKELTKDNAAQQKNVAHIEALTDTLTRFMTACIRIRQTQGFEKAKEKVATGEGRRLLDEVRATIDNAREIEQTLLAQRKQATTEDAQNFNLIFITLLLVMAIVLISVYFIIINNLKALKKAQQEANQKNWTLTGSGELAKGMQGNKQVTELAQTIINHLATWLDAQGGAIYLVEEDAAHFKMAGAYALAYKKNDFPSVRIGEGLVGQCAAEKRNLLISHIPAEHFDISTSFGKILPEHIIAIPVIFEGAVIAVVELGSVHGFSALHHQYLQVVADNIAVGISSSQAREKAKELLEETQRQGEELEAQQEELKQTNEELHEKTELLERSEAELKTQQEELRQTNEELEEKANLLEEQKEKLEATSMEVESKARELELTSKYKSEFLANMSHELRTPLNSILILAQLLVENKSKALGEKEITYAKNIHSSGNDLLELINEILDLSKIESGKVDLEFAGADVGQMVGHLRAMFTEVANTRSIHFEIIDPELPAKLHTDGQRLAQILRNLLSNAFKFTGKNGKVTFRIERQDKTLAFSVTDTGIGIPESKQEIIFQAFQQADGSTKRKYGGTGLGLSISRELAHALGGDIRLQSEEGKGSTFTLSLPLEYDPAITIADRPPREPAAGKIPEKKPARPEEQVQDAIPRENVIDDRYTIQENDRIVLIIEDDQRFADILLDFFRERNYKGIIAYQGNIGLSLARYYRPDAIILDMQLPVMDGSEVLRQLKNDPSLRHIPVQIFSGYDRRKESLQLGAFDFVKKPVTRETMQDAVDKMEEFIRKKLKKLLIVEDNRQQNNAIRELIGNGDVKSFSAYAGMEAFEIMQKEKFDCVIIDLGLPDMSGIELLEKIKANGELNKVPIIVYTGKDLNKEEAARLNKLASTVVLKTANSKERLLDETILFLHRVESNLPKEKQQIIRKLHRTDEVLKNRKVLIVDDDMRNIYSLTNALEEEGLCCITAENGRAAIDALKAQPDTDIVLMDVMMPEMDGYEATQEIRKTKEFGKLPIIALTAKAMKGDREKCLEAGMSDYISKPVNIDQLLSLMRVWLYR
ncbi:response regulator [Flavitalea sp. BT771]|uniref:response regulator n=1 Tax=Flavitalea sp. BT771 TaxID=3063329 RepID=UPI0026E33256|nr:response regulator [Flavitalea sp. BT771]MDO6432735.1 response regulator [Flavitalea sp. BT771]MDV6221989.1 response regulator [Flavitalea sp. BT771]